MCTQFGTHGPAQAGALIIHTPKTIQTWIPLLAKRYVEYMAYELSVFWLLSVNWSRRRIIIRKKKENSRIVRTTRAVHCPWPGKAKDKDTPSNFDIMIQSINWVMCVTVLSFMKEVTVLTILRLLLVVKGRYRQGHCQGHLVKLYLGRIYLGQTCHSNSEIVSHNSGNMRTYISVVVVL